jgi:DNA-binding transcriptional ArsR family regulator
MKGDGKRSVAERGPKSAVISSRKAPSRPTMPLGYISGDPGAKKQGAQLGRAVWAQARTDYITGNESFSQLADRLGVTQSAVEKHASARHRDNGGIGWDEARRRFLRHKNDVAETEAVKAGARVISELRESLATVALLALGRIKGRLEDPNEKIETRDLIGMGKLSATLRIEVAGDPNAPIRIDDTIEHKLNRLTVDELKKLANEKLVDRIISEVPGDVT